MSRATPAAIRNDIQGQRSTFGWALPVSLIVHLLIAALLIFGLPVLPRQPEKEEAVMVELVPPKPLEEAKAQPPPPAQEPKSEKPPDAKVEKPSPTGENAGRPARIPVLRPVFQFGEKDAGPRESRDGNSAEDGAAPPMASRNPDKQELAGPRALTTADAAEQVPRAGAPKAPAPEQADAANVKEAEKLEQAKTLFSQAATGSALATTAMNGIPRSARAGRLCATELREQLRAGSPPYFPDLLPSYPLSDGTVLEINRAAFRANGGQWYNLRFRCEIDADATKVVAFAFRVGDRVAPRDLMRRGLPSQ